MRRNFALTNSSVQIVDRHRFPKIALFLCTGQQALRRHRDKVFQTFTHGIYFLEDTIFLAISVARPQGVRVVVRHTRTPSTHYDELNARFCRNNDRMRAI